MPEAWLDGHTGLADNLVGEDKGPLLPAQPSGDLELSFLRLGIVEIIKLLEKSIALSRLKKLCTSIDQLSKKRLGGVFYDILARNGGISDPDPSTDILK